MIKKKNNICLIYNYAQHYRFGIFKLMNDELQCDFYFGDKMGDVKKIDYSKLVNFKKELKNIKLISSIYWQKGVVSLFFRKYDTYIVLGEYFCLSTWVLLLLCKFSSKKTYLWTHGWYGDEGLVKKIVKKVFYNLGDGILLYGNYAKELMIKEGFEENKLHVVYNSLNYEKQIEVRNSLVKTSIYKDYFKNDFPVLIFIGRLAKSKKLNFVIESQKILNTKNININLVFVGKGDDEENLKNVANKSNLKNAIWFFGESYDETEIGNLIYNADICVSPGNVGLTAMHSLVYGTPVVTHSDFPNQGPEFEAIEVNKTGMFFTENNVEDLSKVINDWLTLKRNREQIRKDCFNKIDSFFNPYYQITVLKNMLNENKK